MPRNKYPEQTVEKILDAAALLFLQKGYQNTTLQDIIDATKLSKGAVYHHFRSKEEIAQRVAQAANILGITEYLDRKPKALSGGQRKLLEMARALMCDPKLVMLDEPMAGVNPALKQILLDHIISLREDGTTVLFVEHDINMVRHIADWVTVMAEGKIVAEGQPKTVMDDPAVVDAYLGAHANIDLGDDSVLEGLEGGNA